MRVVGLALALSVAVSTAPAFADEVAWEPDAPVWIDLRTDALWNSGYAEAIVVEDEGRMVRLQVRDIVGGSEAPLRALLNTEEALLPEDVIRPIEDGRGIQSKREQLLAVLRQLADQGKTGAAVLSVAQTLSMELKRSEVATALGLAGELHGAGFFDNEPVGALVSGLPSRVGLLETKAQETLSNGGGKAYDAFLAGFEGQSWPNDDAGLSPFLIGRTIRTAVDAIWREADRITIHDAGNFKQSVAAFEALKPVVAVYGNELLASGGIIPNNPKHVLARRVAPRVRGAALSGVDDDQLLDRGAEAVFAELQAAATDLEAALGRPVFEDDDEAVLIQRADALQAKAKREQAKEARQHELMTQALTGTWRGETTCWSAPRAYPVSVAVEFAQGLDGTYEGVLSYERPEVSGNPAGRFQYELTATVDPTGRIDTKLGNWIGAPDEVFGRRLHVSNLTGPRVSLTLADDGKVLRIENDCDSAVEARQ